MTGAPDRPCAAGVVLAAAMRLALGRAAWAVLTAGFLVCLFLGAVAVSGPGPAPMASFRPVATALFWPVAWAQWAVSVIMCAALAARRAARRPARR